MFTSWNRLRRYLSCILIAVPVWYIIGVLLIFSPELGRALGLSGEIRAQTTALCWTIGITLGDVVSGVLSQIIKNTKRVLRGFIFVSGLLCAVLLSMHGSSRTAFYTVSFALGVAMGYWAVFLTTAAEQFGTNLRSTVTSTVPNFVRGSAVPITLLFSALKPSLGFVGSAWVVGAICFALAAIALYFLSETYGIDLNFVEQEDSEIDHLRDKPELKRVEGWR